MEYEKIDIDVYGGTSPGDVDGLMDIIPNWQILIMMKCMALLSACTRKSSRWAKGTDISPHFC